MASVDNPKASKATKFGFLNAILYMAPSDSAGVGNLCPHSGACVELCLGEHSGQAAIRREDEDNATTLARKARARAFMQDRNAFMRYVVADTDRLRAIAGMAQYLAGKLPANYSLTFSRDTHNERLAERFLSQGGNVAVVFGEDRPTAWRGFQVIDGDRHDIRTPAMDGRGVVIGLTPKGAKAKRDMSGFIVREIAA
jgi:hypothetical protein